MAASVPLLTNRNFRMPGNAPRMSRASSVSAAVGAPNVVPRRAAAVAARTTSGCAWPRMSGPHEPT